MSEKSLVLFLIACAAVLTVCFVCGWAAVTFPCLLVLGFFVGFASMIFNASIQATASPGLMKLEEPNYWLSHIYNAWLYVNDMERWASYACFWSCVVGALLGSFFGGLSLRGNVTFYVSFASWLVGMFLMLSIAILVAKSDYWSRTTERDGSYDEEKDSNSSFS